MNQYHYKPEYERNLPHIQPSGAILFITFRLADSLPKAVIERLKMEAEGKQRLIRQTAVPSNLQNLLYNERKRQFGQFDEKLDKATTGSMWLRRPEIAEIVVEALHFRDDKVYDLTVFCIMPNHVHAVFAPLEKDDGEWNALQTIMHSLKRHTAREANKVLKREGGFWQNESYDHVIRDQRELERIVAYVLNNPVKAGLVANWEDWPWTYLKES